MNSPQKSALDGMMSGALDRALSANCDSILPSSGFTESVMAAVQNPGPAPLRFPWKRALPGWMAGILALVGFAGADLWVLERMPAAAPATPALDWRALLAHAGTPDAGWILLALLIPAVSLWLTRRLLSSR